MTDDDLREMEQKLENRPEWMDKDLIENYEALIAEVRQLREILVGCRDTLEAVICDEATIAANLWSGDMIPRRLRQIEEALRDGGGIVSICRRTDGGSIT